MLDGGTAELYEVAAIDKGLQPSAERVGSGLSMEEAPCLSGLGVVGDVQVLQQVFGGLGFDQLCITEVQRSRGAIWLLIYLVDDAVANWHGLTWGWCRPP